MGEDGDEPVLRAGERDPERGLSGAGWGCGEEVSLRLDGW